MKDLEKLSLEIYFIFKKINITIQDTTALGSEFLKLLSFLTLFSLFKFISVGRLMICISPVRTIKCEDLKIYQNFRRILEKYCFYSH